MSISSFFNHVTGVAAKRRYGSTTEQINALQASIKLLHETGRSNESKMAALEKVVRAAHSEVKSLRLKLDPPVTKAIGDQASWRETAQAGELAFHKTSKIRSGDDWTSGNDTFWRNMGFSPDGWEGKLVVDVGAGSRLRTLFFKGARIAAIEPLFDQFKAEVAWHDLDQAAEAYPIAAEVLIPELVGRADLIVSINALDHGFHFEQAIQNLRQYLKQEGVAFLSYDQHEKPDHMHPLVLNDQISRDIFERCGFRVEHFKEKSRYHGGDAGPNALCYWLKPA